MNALLFEPSALSSELFQNRDMADSIICHQGPTEDVVPALDNVTGVLETSNIHCGARSHALGRSQIFLSVPQVFMACLCAPVLWREAEGTPKVVQIQSLQLSILETRKQTQEGTFRSTTVGPHQHPSS